MSTKPTPDPAEDEPDIDYEAEFKKLDQQIATTPTQAAPGGAPDGMGKEVRVQFRGVSVEGNPYLQLRVEGRDDILIEGKNLIFIANALPSLGAEGNTAVTWGYLPPPEPTE